jgi:hypothetical protein
VRRYAHLMRPEVLVINLAHSPKQVIAIMSLPAR